MEACHILWTSNYHFNIFTDENIYSNLFRPAIHLLYNFYFMSMTGTE